MADQNRNIASPAPAANSPQPGFVPDAGIFPTGKETTELSNTIGDALAVLGVGGDLPQSKKVEPPKKPKPQAKEKPEAETEEKEAQEEDESETEDETAEAEESETEAESESEETEESKTEEETSDAEDESGRETRNKRRERFDKLTAKLREKDELLKEKDARVAELEERLEQSQSARPAPSPANPLADVEDEPTLNTRLQNARFTQRWCSARMSVDPDTGDQVFLPGKPPGWDRELTAAEVEGYLNWADSVIDAAPEHRKVMAQQQEHRAQAKARYPTMFERGHKDAARRTELLKVITGPERDLIIGRILRAEAEETREADGKGRFVFMPLKPAGEGKPKPKPNGEPNGNGHARANNAPVLPTRTPVTSAERTPKRKLSAAIESGTPVSAEALIFGQ